MSLFSSRGRWGLGVFCFDSSLWLVSIAYEVCQPPPQGTSLSIEQVSRRAGGPPIEVLLKRCHHKNSALLSEAFIAIPMSRIRHHNINLNKRELSLDVWVSSRSNASFYFTGIFSRPHQNRKLRRPEIPPSLSLIQVNAVIIYYNVIYCTVL